MERSISISELPTENGVAVVNAYGSIIGHNEDHVDDSATEVVNICTSPQWKYPLFGLEFEKLIWTVLFADIDLNWPYTFWHRTYCESKGQCVSLWRSHWSSIWCWTTSPWTHGSRWWGTSLNSSGTKTLQVKSKSVTLKRIEKFETHEEYYCIRQASEGFIKDSAYLIGRNVSSKGNEVKIQQIHY